MNAPSASLGLRRIRLLEGLSDETLERLARQCAWRRFTPGQLLIARDAEGGDVVMIVSGKARVNVYSAAGRQVTFRDQGEGDLVGGIAVIDQGPRSADVACLTEGLAAVLPAGEFRNLLRQEPIVADRFMRELASLVRLLSEKVIELSTLGVQNRIHGEILRLAREAPAEGPGRLISPSPKHAEIAARISTTREQVTREISALTRAGVLEKRPDGLLVTDFRELEKIVRDAVLTA